MVEKACRQHVGLLWLTGLHYPDNNTLWRFYRDNRKALKQVFKQAVRLAVKGRLVGMVLNAVDGTKIMADVSRGSGLHQKDLEHLLRRLDKCLDEVFEQIEGAEVVEQGKEYKLPDKLTEKEMLRDFIQEGLGELEKEGVTHLSLTDRDARMMKTGEGVKFAYNAQAVVDAKAGVIVGAEVVQEESDNFELVDMIEEVEENVGEVAKETVADGGYFSGEELKRAEEKRYEVVVNVTMSGKTEKTEGGVGSEFDIWNFRYDDGKDVWICPKGGVLRYEGDKKRKDKGYVVRVYRCQDYNECEHRCGGFRHGGGKDYGLQRWGDRYHLDCSRKRLGSKII